MSNAQICRPIRLLLDGFMQRNTSGTIKTTQPHSRLVVDPKLIVSIVPAASTLPALLADDDTGIPVQENALSAFLGEDAFDHTARLASSAVERDDDYPLTLQDATLLNGQYSRIDHGELARWHADEDALSGVAVTDATFDDFLAALEAI